MADLLLRPVPDWSVGHSPLATSNLVLLDRGTKAGLCRTSKDPEVLGVEVEAQQI